MNGRKLLDLVGVCNLYEGNQLSQCNGRWMWGNEERRSVVDYISPSRGLVMDRMVVEVSGELNLGSYHNLIWCEVRTGRLEEGTSDPRLKWKVDGKIEWNEYQQLVMEGFRGWEEHMAVL